MFAVKTTNISLNEEEYKIAFHVQAIGEHFMCTRKALWVSVMLGPVGQWDTTLVGIVAFCMVQNFVSDIKGRRQRGEYMTKEG
jgi:hypothetical protein